MKKRTLLLCVSLVLSLALAAGGTLAYLSDSDADVNTMTLGNVKIDQLEYERVDVEASGSSAVVQKFNDDKPLYPAVYDDDSAWQPGMTADDAIITWDQLGNEGSWNGIWDPAEIENEVDKFVFVKNTGKSDAYVRTWFAFELGDLTPEEWWEMLHLNVNNSHWTWPEDLSGYEVVEVDGRDFIVCSVVYTRNNGVLEPGELSRPSLLQVALDKTATNKTVEGFGEKYEILVVTQAMQTAGFDNAEKALDEGFGAEPPAFSTTEPEEEAPAKIWENVVPDETIKADEITNGSLTLEDGGVIEIQDLKEPLTITGNGTVIVEDGGISDAEDDTPGILIPSGSNVTLIFKGTNTVTGGTGADGITVEDGAEVVITGPGKLTVEGNGGHEDWTAPTTNGHGIGGSGNITIRDLEDLDAKGFGSGGTGIGGESSKITIENTHISNVQGGFSTITWKPTDYGKSDPEGAPAIGSLTDEAVINLTGDTIVSAKGGSKAAGIGARYWNSVTINITDCVIEEVIGGGYGAGIGASRVQQRTEGDTRQYVTITIVDTTVKMAQGGLYGSGIGSAYDTHTQTPDQSIMTTIYIKGDSDITAYGGERAAGIGTGYHCGALAGEIENSVKVEAKAGGDPYKYGTYTPAQDVGFGILDPTRSGKNNTSVFYFHGVAITQPDPMPPLE